MLLQAHGSVKPRIGSEVFASAFYKPIQDKGSWAVIRSLSIGRDGVFGNSVTLGIDEYPSVNSDNITVSYHG